MKPSPFEYVAPGSVSEAIDQLVANGDEAKLLAGGQSLVPLMNFRFSSPTVLVDLNRVSGLDHVTVDEEVRIGATARQRDVELDADVRAALPLMAEALDHVGHVAVRSRGTVAGSIAHADPAAEMPALLLALDGAVTATGPNGTRRIAAADFFVDVFTTDLEPDELITEVHIPIPRGGTALEEVARRHGDFALAGAVAHVETDGDGVIVQARVALLGVDATPVRATEAEALMVGQQASDLTALEAAGHAASEAVSPDGDPQVPAAYRRRVAGVVTRRALQRATARSIAP